MMDSIERRRRLHDILLALIANQDQLPLLDQEANDLIGIDQPALCINENKKKLNHYQAIIRTAKILDLMIDSDDDHSSFLN